MHTLTKILILDGRIKHLCIPRQDDDYEFNVPFRVNHSVKDIAESIHGVVMVYKFSRGINDEHESIPDWMDW